MLYDRARIQVVAGAGGNGAVSFRREAHVPKGGPDGGDGGRGGDVALLCDPALRDLQAFRYRVHYRAGRGGHGSGNQRRGRDADPLEVRVPPGTVVEDPERDLVVDLVRPGERVVLARGGSGGRGNKRFATATRQAPRLAERGLAGEEAWLELRLKLLADVGLVGLPNAGKSTLLSRLTRARPKVADYPFTTVQPILGTLDGGDRQLVVADIPGLIEGASEGAGLGHEFLAHVERTRLLVHVLDLAPLDGSDPVENHATVEAELVGHGAGLADLPRILCLSKADLVTPEQAESQAAAWHERLGDEIVDLVVTSSATGAGLDRLGASLLRHVPQEPPLEQPTGEKLVEHRVYRPAEDEGFRVERRGSGGFRVLGPQVETLVARHDLENEESLDWVEGRLRTMGVIRALEAAGFTPGDEVEIAGVEFLLDPEAPSR